MVNLVWWAHQDLNLGPKDSGLCSFRCSLDYAFTVAKCFRWVPSSLYTFLVLSHQAWLGVALCVLHVGFAEFDTIPCAVSTRKAQLSL